MFARNDPENYCRRRLLQLSESVRSLKVCATPPNPAHASGAYLCTISYHKHLAHLSAQPLASTPQVTSASNPPRTLFVPFQATTARGRPWVSAEQAAPWASTILGRWRRARRHHNPKQKQQHLSLFRPERLPTPLDPPPWRLCQWRS